MVFKILILAHCILFAYCGKINLKSNNISIIATKMTIHKDYLLQGDVIRSEDVNDLDECAEYCYKTDGCQSTNFADDKKCHLLATNKHIDKEKFIERKGYGYVHLSLMNTGCELNACQNNAVCIPNFSNDSFVCNCAPGYRGEYCEENSFDSIPFPNWWFDFQDSSLNKGISSGHATLELRNFDGGKAVLTGQPDRKGKFLHCHLECTSSTVSWQPWVYPMDATNGVTISIWVRLTAGEKERQLDYEGAGAGRTHIYCRSNLGFCLYYDYNENCWYGQVVTAEKHYLGQIEMAYEKTLNWHFFVLSFNHTTLLFTIDSTILTVKPAPADNPLEHVMTQIFHTYNPAVFGVDEFKVWYQEFTKDQIQSLYKYELHSSTGD